MNLTPVFSIPRSAPGRRLLPCWCPRMHATPPKSLSAVHPSPRNPSRRYKSHRSNPWGNSLCPPPPRGKNPNPLLPHVRGERKGGEEGRGARGEELELGATTPEPPRPRRDGRHRVGRDAGHRAPRRRRGGAGEAEAAADLKLRPRRTSTPSPHRAVTAGRSRGHLRRARAAVLAVRFASPRDTKSLCAQRAEQKTTPSPTRSAATSPRSSCATTPSSTLHQLPRLPCTLPSLDHRHTHGFEPVA